MTLRDVIRLGVETRAIVDAIEALDEKMLVALTQRGVEQQIEPGYFAHEDEAKSARVMLKRFELLLRFKRELAQLENVTPAEEERAAQARMERIRQLFQTTEVKLS